MFKSFTEKLQVSSKPSPQSGRSPQKQGAEPPATVQRSVKLMLAGAAASTVYLVFSLIVMASIKSDLVRWNATLPKSQQHTASYLNSLATQIIVTTILTGLIAIGLWLWMAKMNSAGRNWARIVASVLFVLWSYNTYVSIGQTRGAATLVVSTVIMVVTWLIGIAALYLLWRPDSSAYFKAQSSR
jgi:hypothetical protein